MAIINSLLDTDFHTFTMAQAVLHQYPAAPVRYKFVCRNKEPVSDLDRINDEIDHLCSLRFTKGEIAFLSGIPYLKDDFIEYLKMFQLNREYIKTSLDRKKALTLEIAGPWISTIFFAAPVLAIASEIYSAAHANPEGGEEKAKKILEAGSERMDIKVSRLTDLLKTGQISGFRFADLGTSQRFSRKWHLEVLEKLKAKFRPHIFLGTSNVYFAKKLKIRPMGTMSHQWLQAHQQLGSRFIDSQKAGLDGWIKEYRGDPGIALSDVVGFVTFLNDFNRFYAKLFDGCQHGSGDPVSWCVKLIEHYDRLGIDPMTKYAVFTDGLTLKDAVALHETFFEMINMSFGLGADLTNDFGFEPLDAAIEMVSCNGGPVARLSDTEGKSLCEDPEFEADLKKALNI
jgi:nicotinate phosphoribosyltransferase